MAKDKGQRPVHNIVQVAIQYNNNNNNNNNNFLTSLIQYKSKIDVQQLKLFSSCVHSSRGQLRLLRK